MRTIVVHLRACNSDGSRRSVKIEGVDTWPRLHDDKLTFTSDQETIAQFNIEEVEYWRDVSKDRTAPYVEPSHAEHVAANIAASKALAAQRNCDTCKYVWQAPDAICYDTD